MSILSKVMLVMAFMVSAAQAGVSCRTHNNAALYELNNSNGVLTITAVKNTISFEKIIDELNVEKLIDVLSEDDQDLLGEKIGDMDLESRGFFKGDIIKVELTNTNTVLSIITKDATYTDHNGQTVHGKGMSEALDLSEEVYDIIKDQIDKKTKAGEFKAGSC